MSGSFGTVEVGPSGPTSGVKIAFVGEAPGETEERERLPFVGGAGKILNGMLQEAGIDRAACYFTNVMRIRPPGNDFSKFYDVTKEGKKKVTRPSPALLDGWQRLHDELQSIKPNLVVALGAEPLRALAGRPLPITKWRGSVLSLPCGKVLATYHPAAVMRQWDWRPVSVFDLRRAVKESLSPKIVHRPRNVTICETKDAIQRAFADLLSADCISFDIETETQQITCIGLSTSPEHAWVIPFWFQASGSFWDEADEQRIWSALKALFADPSKRFIAQNAQFDMTFLYRLYGIDVKNLWMDTMAAHALLYPELPKGLDFMASIYTDAPYWKDQGQSDSAEEFWRYCGLDAMVTLECALEIEKELKEEGQWDFYERHTQKLVRPLYEMSLRGIRIDKEKRKKATRVYERYLASVSRRLNEAVGREINPNSPVQMTKLLYGPAADGGLGLKKVMVVDKESGGEKSTTNELAIKTLMRTSKHPVLPLILKHREAQKILSTYLRAELDPDGRMRCSYIIGGTKEGKGGTKTGRLSSRETPFGTGTNLQNIPRGIVRELFVPDPGCVFVQADLSQAEARVVAYLAGEDRLIRVFEEGGDIHKKNAVAIFGVRLEDVTKDQRQLAKKVVHASNYGMGARKFRDELFKETGTWLEEGAVKRMLWAYFNSYPRIKNWQTTTQHVVNRVRRLTTPLGRKRAFLGAWTQDLVREALAHAPQSTVGDLLNMGIIRLHEIFTAPEVIYQLIELLLQVHDSVMAQCPDTPDEIKRTADVLRDALTIPFEVNGRTLVIPVDISVGYNWERLEKYAPQA